MASVRGCEIPEGLFYDIENNIWARLEDNGELRVGMTAYGASLAGSIVAFTPKKAGKEVRQFKSCGTVESGKWVGPIRAPASGEITAVNDTALADPEIINRDPYGHGWLLTIRPDDWPGEAQSLQAGADAVKAFEAKMEADGFGGC